MELSITKQWNSEDIKHDPISIHLCQSTSGKHVTVEFSGPFFGDPTAPSGPSGQSFPELWEYEVVEIFFLAPKDKYLEVEVSPHGQYLLLLLDGARNAIKDMLPMQYSSKINEVSKTWTGRAEVPLSYLPRGVRKLNAYAIHGSGDDRTYEALYPTPKGKYDAPNFHRLGYFKDFDIKDIVSDATSIGTFWDNL